MRSTIFQPGHPPISPTDTRYHQLANFQNSEVALTVDLKSFALSDSTPVNVQWLSTSQNNGNNQVSNVPGSAELITISKSKVNLSGGVVRWTVSKWSSVVIIIG